MSEPWETCSVVGRRMKDGKWWEMTPRPCTRTRWSMPRSLDFASSKTMGSSHHIFNMGVAGPHLCVWKLPPLWDGVQVEVIKLGAGWRADAQATPEIMVVCCWRQWRWWGWMDGVYSWLGGGPGVSNKLKDCFCGLRRRLHPAWTLVWLRSAFREERRDFDERKDTIKEGRK